MALIPAGESSVRTYPHSVRKLQAISTESSVGFSRRIISI
jgi:hypothetical protein